MVRTACFAIDSFPFFVNIFAYIWMSLMFHASYAMSSALLLISVKLSEVQLFKMHLKMPLHRASLCF